jgi:hypothetical protein
LLQQSPSALHSSPWARQLVTWRQRQSTSPAAHAPPLALLQKSEQHWFGPVHASPIGSQLPLAPPQVVPPTQLNEQQSPFTVQAPPSIAHAPVAGPHVVPAQLSVQQSLSMAQVPPSSRHNPTAQLSAPPSSRHWVPAQHSGDAVHAPPVATQPPGCTQKPSAHTPEQHVSGPVQEPSSGVHAASIGAPSIGVASMSPGRASGWPPPPPPHATHPATSSANDNNDVTADRMRIVTSWAHLARSSRRRNP